MGTTHARYTQIANDLRDQITSGQLQPGAPLPSQRHLAETYKASGMTVRQALDVLTTEGLITTRHGDGARVRDYRRIRSDRTRQPPADHETGTSVRAADTAGRNLQAGIISVERTTAPPHVSVLLDVPTGAEVIRRSSSLAIDDRPALAVTSWLPADITAGTPVEQDDPGPGGVYARLAELGHAPAVFREEVTARQPRHGETLQLLPGTPVLAIIRTAATHAGRIVEVTETLVDAASVTLSYSWPTEH
ncbi:MAG: GntR family transcriptional regulator [Actinomycetota bacterium]|nr:GntR family transcriptional regulator [Actinomycetota bacterium]